MFPAISKSCFPQNQHDPLSNPSLPPSQGRSSGCQAHVQPEGRWKLTGSSQMPPHPDHEPESPGNNLRLSDRLLLPNVPAMTQDCREPARDIPLVTKVMRKEARHMQRRDRVSGVPPDILEHLPPETRVCLLYCFVLSPLTLLGAVPHHHLAVSVKELTYSSN